MERGMVLDQLLSQYWLQMLFDSWFFEKAFGCSYIVKNVMEPLV
jgi:hypothetical protein